jgi:OOP family OmpA-OmpF porin
VGINNNKNTLNMKVYKPMTKLTLVACCAALMSLTTSMVPGTKAVMLAAANSGFAKDTDGDGVKDKKDKCPDTPAGVTVDENGCPLDNDKDGVADYLDKCPESVGSALLNGCPDKDNDGVSDNNDACADVPGLARFKGCPDTDGDGIEDAMDRCPNVKGLDIFKGCPDTDGDGVEDGNDKCSDTKKGIKVDANGCPADFDGDGIFDADDKCPTTAGKGSANGCPEIKVDVKKRLMFAAKGINFETGEARLKISSFAVLDEVVSIMKEYPDYILQIGGHTDDVGEDAANMTLSQARVDAVKNFLVTKGVPVDRINAVGYGETKPIESNKTAEGRLQNRRVELDLITR